MERVVNVGTRGSETDRHSIESGGREAPQRRGRGAVRFQVDRSRARRRTDEAYRVLDQTGDEEVQDLLATSWHDQVARARPTGGATYLPN